MMEYFKRHLEGHIRYYGASGNDQQLGAYVYQASRLLFKWLNRRSQRRSIIWEDFNNILRRGLVLRVRIAHNLYPKPLWMAQTKLDALTDQARFCEEPGRTGVWLRYCGTAGKLGG